MFRAASLLAFATLALAVSPGDLKVSLAPVNAVVKSIDDITLTAIVSNPTDADITVVKTATVLDNKETRSFIVSKDGAPIAFTGVEAIPIFEHADNWVTIPAGGSVAVNHTIAALFDFASAGTGTYTFTPTSLFQTKDAAARVAAPAPVTVQVTDDVARRFVFGGSANPVPGSGERAIIEQCSDGRRRQMLTDALDIARQMAGGAGADIHNHPDSRAWNDYFGGSDREEIYWKFDAIAGDLPRLGDITLHCFDKTDGTGGCAGNGWAAYVTGNNAYFCDYWFDTALPTNEAICQNRAPDGARDGIMLHEMSHFDIHSLDTLYFCDPVKTLDPALKHENADNFRCFAQQTWRDYRC